MHNESLDTQYQTSISDNKLTLEEEQALLLTVDKNIRMYTISMWVFTVTVVFFIVAIALYIARKNEIAKKEDIKKLDLTVHKVSGELSFEYDGRQGIICMFIVSGFKLPEINVTPTMKKEGVIALKGEDVAFEYIPSIGKNRAVYSNSLNYNFILERRV